MSEQNNIFLLRGIKLSFKPYAEIDELLKQQPNGKYEHISIGYANQYTITLTSNSENLKEIFTKFSFIFPDGIGVHTAVRFLKLNGVGYGCIQNATDLNYKILEFTHYHSKKMFVLGSTQMSMEKFIENIRKSFPGIQIVGYHDGYNDINSLDLIEQINNSKADILIVGMGQPKQELWYNHHREQISIPVTVMVGGFIDFFSGYKKRAPKIFRLAGLEWLFRLLQEPQRLWKRYLLGIPKFIIIILKQRLIIWLKK